MSEGPNVFYFPPLDPPMRWYRVTEPITIGEVVLRPGAEITWDSVRNIFEDLNADNARTRHYQRIIERVNKDAALRLIFLDLFKRRRDIRLKNKEVK